MIKASCKDVLARSKRRRREEKLQTSGSSRNITTIGCAASWSAGKICNCMRQSIWTSLYMIATCSVQETLVERYYGASHGRLDGKLGVDEDDETRQQSHACSRSETSIPAWAVLIGSFATMKLSPCSACPPAALMAGILRLLVWPGCRDTWPSEPNNVSCQESQLGSISPPTPLAAYSFDSETTSVRGLVDRASTLPPFATLRSASTTREYGHC
jgi:hypothetical protein